MGTSLRLLVIITFEKQTRNENTFKKMVNQGCQHSLRSMSSYQRIRTFTCEELVRTAKASTQVSCHIKHVSEQDCVQPVGEVKEDSQQIMCGAPTVQQKNSSKCSLQPSDLEMEHEYRL
ncbi:hypothetical protein BgiMline_019259 [Biomphalaria glabrata]|nr:hypothetical protein BgiMline_032125 [Biomphalaria glabrata]